MAGFAVSGAVRGNIPRAAFSRMKKAILGGTYDLSVAIVDAGRMRAVNRAFQKKDTATDVLAFPYSADSGEILLHLPSVRRNAKHFSLSFEEYRNYVFIHALLHLKGHVHGRTMEKLEDTWSLAFGIATIPR